VFILVIEFLHLLSSPLWDGSVLLHSEPEGVLVQFLRVVAAHQREELETLDDSKLLLLADVEVLALVLVCFEQNVIIFDLKHFIAADFIWVLLCHCFINGFLDPAVEVDRALVEVFDLEQLSVVRLDLVCEALVLIDNHTTVFLDHLLAFFVYLLFLWVHFRNIKHLSEETLIAQFYLLIGTSPMIGICHRRAFDFKIRSSILFDRSTFYLPYRSF
jgi:hypothetical protein